MLTVVMTIRCRAVQDRVREGAEGERGVDLWRRGAGQGGGTGS